MIQERYAWFLDNALDDGGQRKKGQRKIPLADRIIMNFFSHKPTQKQQSHPGGVFECSNIKGAVSLRRRFVK